MPIQVEIDLYSGRPNPRFVLPAADAAEFERRLAGLAPLPAGTGGVRDGLGYRGVRVVGHAAGAAEIVVSNGVVEIRGTPGGVTRRADPGRALERWLIEVGSGRVPPDDLAVARDDLAR